MRIKRRQVLTFLGSLGSLGLAVAVHKALTATHPNSSLVNTSATPSNTPSLSSSALAPTGLFAPPRGDVRIVVISDLNSQYGSTSYEEQVDQAIALVPDWQPDLVLCGGDMVAGQKSSLTREQINAMWTAFDQHIAAPLRQAGLPFGFTIGNHDASGALAANGQFLFENERDLATVYWQNPNHDLGLQFVDREGFPFYYSFKNNDIFYLVWDASTPQISATQLAWVEQSLASPPAQTAKMRIVIGHLPLYAVAVGRDKLGEILNRADELRSLLQRYRVHTYISGHHHAYFPGYRGELELLHAGALGSGPRPLLNSNLPTRNTLTVVDVNLNAETTTYTTYDMQTLEVVDHSQLPRIIVGPKGWVLRRDVNWDDLTPEERSLLTPS